MRKHDPVFRAAYEDAMADAADLVEAEAWRRALDGIPQILMKAGQPVLDPVTGETITVRRYSDPLLLMLLRGFKPGKFHRRSGATATPVDPDAGMKEIAADTDPPRASSGHC